MLKITQIMSGKARIRSRYLGYTSPLKHHVTQPHIPKKKKKNPTFLLETKLKNVNLDSYREDICWRAFCAMLRQ